MLPLYSSLPPAQQQQVFEPTPAGHRKVVVATNIAETSITIDGVVYVIDPGFSKQNVFDPRSRISSLLVTPISKASARQRAGRAGRTRPGKCFRLYPEESFNTQLQVGVVDDDETQEQSYPEIMRSDISSVVLTMLKLGIKNLVRFDFMDPPAPETMMRALENLNYLGALDDEGQLTTRGEQMADLPLEPQLAVALLAAPSHNVLPAMLRVAAMLAVPPCFVRPAGMTDEAEAAKAMFGDPSSDHVTLMHVLEAYEKTEEVEREKWCESRFVNARVMKNAVSVKAQLEGMLKKLGLNTEEGIGEEDPVFSLSIRQCLCEGYFMQVAHREKDGTYRTVKDNEEVELQPGTELRGKPAWVLFNSVKMTKKNFIQTVTAIDGEWLINMAPKYYDMRNFPPSSARDELLAIIRRKEMGQQEAHRRGFLNPKRRRLCSVCFSPFSIPYRC